MPSVRKSYDEELLQLDTLLARMGHEAGAAIESALTALRNDDIELAPVSYTHLDVYNRQTPHGK